MRPRHWIVRAVAAATVYFGWGIGFALLETAWRNEDGAVDLVAALVVPLTAGAIARLLDRSRLLPLLAVAVVVIDTVGAHLAGAVSQAGALDLTLRALPLAAVLAGIAVVARLAKRDEG